MDFLQRMVELIHNALNIPDLNLRRQALDAILERLRSAKSPVHGDEHAPIPDDKLRDFCAACGRLINSENRTVGRTDSALYESTIGSLIVIASKQLESLKDLEVVNDFLKGNKLS